MAEVVAIQDIVEDVVVVVEATGEPGGEGAFAGAGEAGEPEDEGSLSESGGAFRGGNGAGLGGGVGGGGEGMHGTGRAGMAGGERWGTLLQVAPQKQDNQGYGPAGEGGFDAVNLFRRQPEPILRR